MVRRIRERLEGVYNSGTEDLRRMRLEKSRRALSKGGAGSGAGGSGKDAAAAAPNAALEVRGQVTRLLKEATDDANLCQMYVGWMPFL